MWWEENKRKKEKKNAAENHPVMMMMIHLLAPHIGNRLTDCGFYSLREMNSKSKSICPIIQQGYHYPARLPLSSKVTIIQQGYQGRPVVAQVHG